MKIHKKIWIGLVIAAATTFGVSSIVSPSSVLALDKQSDRFYYDSCVDLVGPGNRGLTNCTFFDDRNLTREDLLFSKGDFEVSFITGEALYHVPYDADRYSKPPPPSEVSILDKDAKPISVNGNALGGRFIYFNQSFTSPGYDIPYYIYSNTADPDYVVLVALKSNGDLPLILAMVNKKVQDDPRGDSRGTVYAYEINKVATGSTTTGAPIITPVTPPPGDVTGTNAACYTWEWSWAVCPVITAAQTTANAMYGFVEDQLKFTVQQNCTKDSGCNDSLGGDYKSVHSAWSNFRILVSGLVVILLLVMVISQAIGTGPFDAYTVRKMLPRLVMGVILIQISWPLFSWVINTVDDLGRGLADLMYVPFGGSDALDLNTIMKPFTDNVAGGIKVVAFNYVGIGALAVFGAVAPFVVLGLILTVLVAIFVGFLTLLFRKILIILALIFVPVALISWMMPNDGLRKYWKLWWDNFSKALMMYPLIIAIIAGGRIFAKIGSGGHDFVGFFIVLVGFFGPLFILPKTFKWGGTVMTMAGNGISKAQERTLKKPKEFLGERQKGWSAERTRQSQERFSHDEGFNLRRPWRRPIDLVKSGRVDPTLWGRRREQAMRGYRAKGVESEEADAKAADQDFGQSAAQSENHDDFARRVGGARIGEEITWTDKEAAARGEHDNRRLRVTAAMKRAGMNGMAKFGTDRTFRELGRIMNELNHGTAEEQILAERFLDANVGTLKPRMDYLYRGQSRALHGSDAVPDTVLDPATGAVVGLTGPIASRVEALVPETFAQMEAPELEAMLAGLSQVANHHPDANARTAAEGYLRTIYTHYEGALDNDQVRRSMGGSLNQAMKAHLDGTNRVRINTSRTQAGLATQIEQVGATATPATIAIANRIGADGTAR